MKTFIGILLVGFLGFLGCSGSNDGTSTTSNTVGEANPVAPFGIIDTLDPIYEWTPVPWATKYRLLVQDTNQASTTLDTNETYIIDEWYTAEEAGCASEEVLCTVHPGIVTVNENAWKVQACANQECGLWSELLHYHMSPSPITSTERFTDNGDGTVTDNNTKLMWSKNANLGGLKNWWDANSYCAALALAVEGPCYVDWRLPSAPELYSLIDTEQYAPALPPGNPFYDVQCKTEYHGGGYWTSTVSYTGLGKASGVWTVSMCWPGIVRVYDEDQLFYVWPVRSAN